MQPVPIEPKAASLLAKVCVVLTLLLILVGAIVTTSGTGMATPHAPHVEGTLLNPNVPGTQTPFYLDPGYLREHGHRLVAMAVAVAVGALAALLWRNWIAFAVCIILMGAAAGLEHLGMSKFLVAHLRVWPPMILFLGWLIVSAKRRGEKITGNQWMVFIAFLATGIQAMFGTLRVELETAGKLDAATMIRTTHGVFAQMFLAWLVILATRLSPINREIVSHAHAKKLHRMTIALLFLYFIQLACAAYLRHRPGTWAAIPHWPQTDASGGWLPVVWTHTIGILFLHSRVLPFLIFGHVIGMAFGFRKRAYGERRLTRPAWGLLILVLIQIALGASIYLWHWDAHTVNTHVIVGALICATAAMLFARTSRLRPA